MATAFPLEVLIDSMFLRRNELPKDLNRYVRRGMVMAGEKFTKAVISALLVGIVLDIGILLFSFINLERLALRREMLLETHGIVIEVRGDIFDSSLIGGRNVHIWIRNLIDFTTRATSVCFEVRGAETVSGTISVRGHSNRIEDMRRPRTCLNLQGAEYVEEAYLSLIIPRKVGTLILTIHASGKGYNETAGASWPIITEERVSAENASRLNLIYLIAGTALGAMCAALLALIIQSRRRPPPV